MRNLILSLSFLVLAACAGGSGGSGGAVVATAPVVVTPTSYAYTLSFASCPGSTFAFTAYENFGDADQVQTDSGIFAIPVGGQDINFTGRSFVVSLQLQNGNCIVTLYRDGQAVEMESPSTNGQQYNWSY